MLWWILGGLAVGLGGLLAGALGLGLAWRSWYGWQRWAIKQYVLRHPEAGDLQADGRMRYRHGVYVVEYLHHPDLHPPHHILWLSTKRRLPAVELRLRAWWRRMQVLGSWEGVLQLANWRTGGLLVLALLLGGGWSASEAARLRSMEWLMAGMLGVPADQVRIDPAGWVRIDSVRRTAGDQTLEPVTVGLHPVRWLFGGQHGYVLRYRGDTYGYVVHPLHVGNRAEVWLQKDGAWRHGAVQGDRVVWSQPQGTGVREGLVREQALPTLTDVAPQTSPAR